MRTETIIKEIFEFDELTPEMQKSVIDKNRHYNVDGCFDWWDSVYEDSKNIAELIGINITDIYFSGFSSQGDGACFVGSYSYEKGCLKAIKEYAPLDKVLHDIVKRLVLAQRKAFYQASANIARGNRSNFYSHSGTMGISVENFDYTLDIPNDSYDDIVQCLQEFADWIYSALEREYNFQTSDESVKDSLICNAREFDSDGNFA
ncbi:MAG: hypothetical protein KAT90_06515 [Gammaproteobacteria bacterium]|nr:hypothetical protein [Gammaproteobacteria bacterium]